MIYNIYSDIHMYVVGLSRVYNTLYYIQRTVLRALIVVRTLTFNVRTNYAGSLIRVW